MKALKISEVNKLVGLKLMKYGMAECKFKEDFDLTLKNGENFRANHIVCYENDKGHSQVVVVGNEIVREVGKTFTCLSYSKFNTAQKNQIVEMLDLNTVKIHNIRKPHHRF